MNLSLVALEPTTCTLTVVSAIVPPVIATASASCCYIVPKAPATLSTKAVVAN